jgi:AcrR family transcriptional regulator
MQQMQERVGDQACVRERTTSVDRRTLRTKRALREALAEEIKATGDLSRVTVTALTDRAGVTRRTFYTHYRDIPDFVQRVEAEALEELSVRIQRIAKTTLEELVAVITDYEAVPAAVTLLAYIKENGDLYSALLGEGGDPNFAERIKRLAHDIIAPRALTGLDASAAGFFDYYITYAVSAEVGVLVRWLDGGMQESCEVMGRIMTVLTFVRPGDLYGVPIGLDIPAYSAAIMRIKEESHD